MTWAIVVDAVGGSSLCASDGTSLVANGLFGSGETYWTEADLRRHLNKEGFRAKGRISEEMYSSPAVAG